MNDTLTTPNLGDNERGNRDRNLVERVASDSHEDLATMSSPPIPRASQNIQVTPQPDHPTIHLPDDTLISPSFGDDELENNDRNLVEHVASHRSSGSEAVLLTRWQRSKRWTKRTWQIHCVNKWTIEWVASAFSLSCLSAIYIVVGIFSNRSVEQWHSYFSINTMLSALGTAMRVGVIFATGMSLAQLKWLSFERKTHSFDDFGLYEEASHGVFGSMQLLYRLRFWHLASLGALATVLSLFSDAFIQASAVTSSRGAILEGGAASTPVATDPLVIDPDQIGQSGPGWLWTVEGDMSPDGRIKSAMYVAMTTYQFAGGIIGFSPVCVTGNCEFPWVSSLGMCSQCLDQSGSILLQDGEIVNGEAQLRTATVTTASGGNITLQTQNLTLTEGYLNSTIIPSRSFQNSTQLLLGTLDIIVLAAPGMSPQSQSGYSAFRCDFNLCSVTEQSDIINGAREVKATGPSIFNGKWRGGPNNTRFTFEGAPNPSIEVAIGKDDWQSLANYINSGILVGNVITQNGSVQASSDTIKGIYEAINGEGQLSGGYGVYNNIITIPDYFDSVATVVTNGMRITGADAGISISGTTIGTESYIRIRWLYLILPTIMVVLSIILLASTVLQSRQRGTPIWKSSIFASIVHASGIVKEQNRESLRTIAELDEWAKDIQAGISHGSGQPILTAKETYFGT